MLISAGHAFSNQTGSAGFWYDTVLLHCMLLENGFAAEDIYVLYGNGYDGFYTRASSGLPARPTRTPTLTPAGTGQMQEARSADRDPRIFYQPPFCGDQSEPVCAETDATRARITDLPLTMRGGAGVSGNNDSRVHQIFQCLADGCRNPKGTFEFDDYAGGSIAKLGPQDFLFVWWRGHAGWVESEGIRHLRLSLPRLTGVMASDVEKWMSAIETGRRLLVFDVCHSGCLANDIPTVNTPAVPPAVLLMSSSCESSSNGVFEPDGDVAHALWSYWMAGVLSGSLPNDGSAVIGDIAIKLSRGGPVADTYDEASKATNASMASPQLPQISDDTDLAPSLRVDVDDPVSFSVTTPTPTTTPSPTPTATTKPGAP